MQFFLRQTNSHRTAIFRPQQVTAFDVLLTHSHFATILFMNAIITVVGSDKVGIIAHVTAFLAKHSINIADITQTILSGNFVMMMMVDLSKSDISIDELRKEMLNESSDMGVEVNVMNEKVFSTMHRI